MQLSAATDCSLKEVTQITLYLTLVLSQAAQITFYLTLVLSQAAHRLQRLLYLSQTHNIPHVCICELNHLTFATFHSRIISRTAVSVNQIYVALSTFHSRITSRTTVSVVCESGWPNLLRRLQGKQLELSVIQVPNRNIIISLPACHMIFIVHWSCPS